MSIYLVLIVLFSNYCFVSLNPLRIYDYHYDSNWKLISEKSCDYCNNGGTCMFSRCFCPSRYFGRNCDFKFSDDDSEEDDDLNILEIDESNNKIFQHEVPHTTVKTVTSTDRMEPQNTIAIVLIVCAILFAFLFFTVISFKKNRKRRSRRRLRVQTGPQIIVSSIDQRVLTNQNENTAGNTATNGTQSQSIPGENHIVDDRPPSYMEAMAQSYSTSMNG